MSSKGFNHREATARLGGPFPSVLQAAGIHREYRHQRVFDHVSRHTPKPGAFEPLAAMGAHDDEIDPLSRRNTTSEVSAPRTPGEAQSKRSMKLGS
jgi:hypothetical protein